MWEKIRGMMSKRKFAYIALIIVIALFSTVAYTASYLYAKKNFNFDDVRMLSEQEKNNPVILTPGSDNAEGSSVYVKSKTSFVMEDYNIDTGKTSSHAMENNIPYLGMNLEMLLDYISKHPDDFSEDGMEIRNVMLISFSENRVIIRRSYRERSEEPTTAADEIRYYIMEKDGYIVIYKSDKRTIFLLTEISVDIINDDERELLNEGIGVKDIHDLYGYLESFTS